MQIKTYTDAPSFVQHLQEAQRQGQRIRLGQTEGTLEVFEAPSRTFGRGGPAQYEVDQAIVREQEALGHRLNELVAGLPGLSTEPGSLRHPLHIPTRPGLGAPPTSAQEQQTLLTGLRHTLTHLQALQKSAPDAAPQALPLRLAQVQQLLEHPAHGGSDEVVTRALSLLNAEVSSLRFMVAQANDPDHPVGAFCAHVRQAHALRQQPDARTGLRPGHDVLAATEHPRDPQAFRRFFSRAAHAVAAALDQPQLKHLAQQLRHWVGQLTHPGLRSSQLHDVARQATAMREEVTQALDGHPLQAATRRVFDTVAQADFLAMENLLTTELIEAGNALADHGHVEIAHEMLQMGRKLAAQSDIPIKDLGDTVAVLRLLAPQLQALASDPGAFAPDTTASQPAHQLSASRCEADQQCVQNFIRHFIERVETAPLDTSDTLAVQSALVRHPEWLGSQEAQLSTAGSALASAVGTRATTLSVPSPAQTSHAEFQAARPAPSPVVQAAPAPTPSAPAPSTPAASAPAPLPNRDLLNADLLIQDLAQLDSFLGTRWREEARALMAQLQQGLGASEAILAIGANEAQEELAYQQTLHQHVTRLERLLQTSESQRPAHALVAAHASRPDLSLADQLVQKAPDWSAQAFMTWLDGQLLSARGRLAATQPPSGTETAQPELARLRGMRQALEIEVQQLQRTRDDAVALWGNDASAAPSAPVNLADLQAQVQQALLGTEDARADTLLDPAALRPVQDSVRQQVEAQLRHRLEFGQAPLRGLNDADFAVAIGLQSELDYLGATTDEMVMLQAWAMRAAQGWESSDAGEAGAVMADALQGAVQDLRARVEGLRSVSSDDGGTVVARTASSPNGRPEEVFESEGGGEAVSPWIAFAAQAAAQALEQRANALENVSSALRSRVQTLV